MTHRIKPQLSHQYYLWQILYFRLIVVGYMGQQLSHQNHFIKGIVMCSGCFCMYWSKCRCGALRCLFCQLNIKNLVWKLSIRSLWKYGHKSQPNQHVKIYWPTTLILKVKFSSIISMYPVTFTTLKSYSCLGWLYSTDNVLLIRFQ